MLRIIQKLTLYSPINSLQVRGVAVKKRWRIRKLDKKDRDRKIGPKLESDAQSLATKGFLRSQKEYNPPQNVTQTIKEISERILGPTITTNDPITNQHDRYALFMECIKVFDHSLPNSLLHTINNLNDLIEFYKTPINTLTPFDSLLIKKLPANLHIQENYVRFTPETSDFFNGVSAYPKSSTIVTGLKSRKKYVGHKEESPWEDLN